MADKETAAIVLAAGKGTRLKAKKINKTMMPLNGKPMVAYAIGTLKKLKLSQIILVIGFAKNSITSYFNSKVDYAVQKKRLGTAHAVKIGLCEVDNNIDFVLVTYGDDSAFYPQSVFNRLIKACAKKNASFSLLTFKKENPLGLGRIIRDKNGNLLGIVEEKNASKSQKKINEVNAGTYCFKKEFLKKYLPKIKKNQKAGEYYLTDIVELAIADKLCVETVNLDKEACWHGVNTYEELEKAQEKMVRLNIYGHR